MKSRTILILALCTSSSVFAQQSINRIAFGSCSAHFGKQRIWNTVIDKKPDLWIWLGDNIYADTEDMEKMAYRYAQLDSNMNYQRLKSTVPMIATWDDHDFGGNNLGRHYPKKAESQQLFLKHFNEPKDSPRWNQEGIYISYTYGSGDRKVKIYMLDTRYHRDDPGPEADMLGEAQWAWLEQEFRSSDATINIIASSVQFVNEFKPFENWVKFPKSQQRLVDLIASTGLKGAFIISGDVHYADISKNTYPPLGYPIYDFTSSGLTHGNQIAGFKNTHRMPGTRFGFRNFATIEFDWEKRELEFRIHDRLGTRVFKHDVPFSEIGH